MSVDSGLLRLRGYTLGQLSGIGGLLDFKHHTGIWNVAVKELLDVTHWMVVCCSCNVILDASFIYCPCILYITTPPPPRIEEAPVPPHSFMMSDLTKVGNETIIFLLMIDQFSIQN